MFLILGAGAVSANELADAAKALQNKDYPQALSLYTRLATAGNPEAALRLGEMYWYGEGAPLDRARGDALFAKAAAGGSQAAVAAASLTGQRQQRLGDISYWVGGYDGADLVAGKFNCAAPAFPQHSETKRGIGDVSAAYDAYTECYNGFISNLENALPPGKRIPVDVALLMSEQELGQAREHLAKVYATVAARGKLASDQAVAQRGQWMNQTTAYLTSRQFRQQQYLAEFAMGYRQLSQERGWSDRGSPSPRAVTSAK
ncbi:MAG: sel1 repeat family protein [Telluria sp.]